MEFFRWLEGSVWGTAIRQSSWLYPALEIVHIIGITVLVGAAFLFDLRLLGFSKSLSLSAMASHLLPWSRRGLLLVLPSGVLLFISNAETLATDRIFWIKMTLLILAALNATLFQSVIFKSLKGGNGVSTAGKMIAGISITLWIAVITCGRLLAY